MILLENNNEKVILEELNKSAYLLKCKVDSIKIGGFFNFIEFENGLRISVGDNLSKLGKFGIVTSIRPTTSKNEHWFKIFIG